MGCFLNRSNIVAIPGIVIYSDTHVKDISEKLSRYDSTIKKQKVLLFIEKDINFKLPRDVIFFLGTVTEQLGLIE